MYLVSLLFALMLASSSTISFAQEHGESAPVEGATEKDFSGKQSLDWMEFQQKLAEQKGKLDSQKIVVEELIAAKSHVPADQRIEAAEELQIEHRKLLKMIDDYNQRSAEYETKFPEKGVKVARIYKRVDPKSIESIENDMTLEGRLSRLHGKVIRQYPRSANQSKDAKSKNKGHGQPAPPTKPVEKDVTDQIILQK